MPEPGGLGPPNIGQISSPYSNRGRAGYAHPLLLAPPNIFHLPASLYFKRGGCRTLCRDCQPPFAVIGGSMFDSVAKNLIKQTVFVTQQNLCAALLDLIFIIIEFCNRN